MFFFFQVYHFTLNIYCMHNITLQYETFNSVNNFIIIGIYDMEIYAGNYVECFFISPF